MRILMVLDAPFPPDIRVEKEAESLVEAGHEVHVLSYRFSRAIPPDEFVRGVRVHRFYTPRQVAKKALGLLFHLPIYRWLWQYQIARAIRRLAPDAVHVHDLPLAWPASEAAASAENRPVLLLDLHENYPDLLRGSTYALRFPQRLFFDYDRWRRLEGRMARKADYLLVVNADNGQRLQEEHGVRAPITVVPNTVRLKDFQDDAPPGEIRAFFDPALMNLLYVGGIDPTRGLDTVLKGIAASGDLRERLRLVIVGSGSYRRELEELAQALAVSARVHFAGQVPQSQVGAFCRCADICLLPLIRSENNERADPNKLYQYALRGKPILAAGAASIQERIAALECGSTYTPDDPASFAEALRAMTSDPERLAQQGKRGRAHVMQEYNWEKTVQSLLDLYAQLGEGV